VRNEQIDAVVAVPFAPRFVVPGKRDLQTGSVVERPLTDLEREDAEQLPPTQLSVHLGVYTCLGAPATWGAKTAVQIADESLQFALLFHGDSTLLDEPLGVELHDVAKLDWWLGLAPTGGALLRTLSVYAKLVEHALLLALGERRNALELSKRHPVGISLRHTLLHSFTQAKQAQVRLHRRGSTAVRFGQVGYRQSAPAAVLERVSQPKCLHDERRCVAAALTHHPAVDAAHLGSETQVQHVAPVGDPQVPGSIRCIGNTLQVIFS
jgi:hypothetical protein